VRAQGAKPPEDGGVFSISDTEFEYLEKEIYIKII
jgi:hypothetical protein